MRLVGPVGCALLAGALLCAGATAGQALAGDGPPSGAAAPDPKTANWARELYEKGRTLAEASKWEPAYREFRAAYAVLAHWQIAGALGYTAFMLGKYPEAIEMLSRHLAEATDLTQDERVQLRKRIDDAKSRCGTIRLVGPSGAAVKVDGANVGTLPLGKELYVLPGSHTVEITGSVTTVKRTVEVTAGKEAAAIDGSAAGGGGKAMTDPAASGAPTATASATSTVGGGGPADTPPNLVPGIVLGAAAGVALLTGAGVLAASEGKGGEARTAALAYDALPAGGKTDAAKKSVGDLLREQDAMLTGAVVAWIGAAALAGGAGAYFFYRGRAGAATSGRVIAPAAAVRWAPVVSPAGAGVVVHGSF